MTTSSKWISSSGSYIFRGAVGLFNKTTGSPAIDTPYTGYLYTKPGTRSELYYKDSDGTEIQITENGALKVSGGGTSEYIISPDLDKKFSIDNTGLLTLTDLPSTELGRLYFGDTNSIFIGKNAGSVALTKTRTIGIGENTISLGEYTGPTDCVFIGYEAGRGVSGQVFGTNNVAIGSYAVNTGRGNGNIGIGYCALRYVSAVCNVAIGSYALNNNISGSYNVVIGDNAARYISSPSNNVVIGASALGNSGLSTHNYNVIIGYAACFGTTGSANTDSVLIGRNAGYFSSGAQNVFIGYQAGFGSGTSTRNYNVAIGSDSLYSITSGSSNTCVGICSARSLTSGGNNSVFGAYAFQSAYNTSSNNSCFGAYSGFYIRGDRNVCVGFESLFCTNDTNTKEFNTAVGYRSLCACSASYNTAVGYRSGVSNTTGQYNLFLGYEAGTTITTGSNNIVIGRYPGDSSGDTYRVFIGGTSTYKPLIAGMMPSASSSSCVINADTFVIRDKTSATNYFVQKNGKCSIYEDAPDVSVGGLCLNMQASGLALSLKGKNINHGLTGVCETDTFAFLAQTSGNYGALHLTAVNSYGTVGDESVALTINAYGKAMDVIEPSSSKRTALEINCAGSGSTTPQTLPDNALIFSIRNNKSGKFFIDGAGNAYTDGTHQTFDDYEDIKLVKEFSTKQYDMLVKAGIITPSGLFCINKATSLSLGAIHQIFNVIRGIAEKIGITEEELYKMALEYKY